MLGNFDHRVLLCFIAVANVVHVQTGMRILHEQLTDLTGTSPLRDGIAMKIIKKSWEVLGVRRCLYDLIRFHLTR